jgi:putative flippase GtrA
MDTLAEFIRKHPWWQWLTRTPFSAKMTKYALSSVIAFLLSVIAFPFVYWIDGGMTTIASIVAFFAAAIPNWLMNRRWAWQQTGRAPVKQMVSYAAVSAFVLFITALTTGRTNYWIKHDAHIQDHHGLRLLIVEGSFVLITVILFFAKFAIYEFVIFRNGRPGQIVANTGDPGDGLAGQAVGDPAVLPGRRRFLFSSRRNVNKIARANRIP